MYKANNYMCLKIVHLVFLNHFYETNDSTNSLAHEIYDPYSAFRNDVS